MGGIENTKKEAMDASFAQKKKTSRDRIDQNTT